MNYVSSYDNGRCENMKEMSKRDIRLEVLEKRARMSPEERASKSRAIGDRLMKTGQWADAKTVFLYMSLPGEVETDRLIAEAWSQGKQVAVPKVTEEGLVFSKLDSFEELSEGSFHVREPKMIREISDGSALVIMPGVAFDKKCNRIGYGKGFYDRYLFEHRGHPAVALSYDFAVYSEIPSGPHDIKPGLIITEYGSYPLPGTENEYSSY